MEPPRALLSLATDARAGETSPIVKVPSRAAAAARLGRYVWGAAAPAEQRIGRLDSFISRATRVRRIRCVEPFAGAQRRGGRVSMGSDRANARGRRSFGTSRRRTSPVSAPAIGGRKLDPAVRENRTPTCCTPGQRCAWGEREKGACTTGGWRTDAEISPPTRPSLRSRECQSLKGRVTAGAVLAS